MDLADMDRDQFSHEQMSIECTGLSWNLVVKYAFFLISPLDIQQSCILILDKPQLVRVARSSKTNYAPVY